MPEHDSTELSLEDALYQMTNLIAQAVKKERKRCAEIAERYAEKYISDDSDPAKIAAEIRSGK